MNMKFFSVLAIALLLASPLFLISNASTNSSSSATKSKCKGPLNCAGGYVTDLTPSGLTTISMNFTVPTVNCAKTPNGQFNFIALLSNVAYPKSGGAAVWAGVSIICSGGVASYVTDLSTTTSTFVVNSGDKVKAAVYFQPGLVTPQLQDFTQKENYVGPGASVASTYDPVAAQCGGGSSGSSSSVLVDFGVIQVSSCTMAVSYSGGIGLQNHTYEVSIYNSSGKTLLASPSKLESNGAFTLTWRAA